MKKQKSDGKIIGHWTILLTIFAIWLYIVSKNYYHLNPIRLNSLGVLFQWHIGQITPQRLMLLLDYLFSVGLLLMILLVAYFLGKKFLKWLKIDFEFSLEETVFSIGLGFGVLAYITLFLGLLGLLYTSLFYGLIGILLVLAIIERF